MPTPLSTLARPLSAALGGVLASFGLPLTAAQCPLGEAAKVVPTDIVAGDLFGTAVAVDGDVAIVGAERDDDGGTWAGSAHVLERTTLGWAFTAKLVPPPGIFQHFGAAVGVSGNTLVVGAYGGGPGAAYLYERRIAGWSLERTFSAPPNSLDFGSALAIDGDTLAVGSPRAGDNGQNSGAVEVYSRDQDGPDLWGLAARVVAPDGEKFDQFGGAVALAEDTLVVGAPIHPASAGGEGAVYVFERDLGGPDNWGFATKLLAADGTALAMFGSALAIDGDIVVAGAYRAPDALGVEVGAAYLFERNVGGPGTFGFLQKFVSPTPNLNDSLGISVAVRGDRALLGTLLAQEVFVLERDVAAPGTWAQIHQLQPSDGAPGSALGFWFGRAIALGADCAIVGAALDGQNGDNAGAAYLFEDGLSTSATHCTAKISSSGCQPGISTSGSASVSAPTGFVIRADEIEARRVGLLTYGTNGPATIPFTGGLLCAAPPIRFVGIQFSGGQAACSGALSFDFNSQVASGSDPNLVAGARVDAQFWFRDPSDAAGLGLTDAVEFVLCP